MDDLPPMTVLPPGDPRAKDDALRLEQVDTIAKLELLVKQVQVFRVAAVLQRPEPHRWAALADGLAAAEAECRRHANP
jgi:hypothetical protein